MCICAWEYLRSTHMRRQRLRPCIACMKTTHMYRWCDCMYSTRGRIGISTDSTHAKRIPVQYSVSKRFATIRKKIPAFPKTLYCHSANKKGISEILFILVLLTFMLRGKKNHWSALFPWFLFFPTMWKVGKELGKGGQDTLSVRQHNYSKTKRDWMRCRGEKLRLKMCWGCERKKTPIPTAYVPTQCFPGHTCVQIYTDATWRESRHINTHFTLMHRRRKERLSCW